MHEVDVEVEITLQPTVSRPVLDIALSSGADDQIFTTVGHWRSSCCGGGAPSLTRGLVCNLLLRLLLGLARAVSLGPKSRRTDNYILLSDMSLLQPRGPGRPVTRSKLETHALCVAAATFVIPSGHPRAEM
jgi:hypothetical protein